VQEGVTCTEADLLVQEGGGAGPVLRRPPRWMARRGLSGRLGRKSPTRYVRAASAVNGRAARSASRAPSCRTAGACDVPAVRAALTAPDRSFAPTHPAP
jgi:hypothetical protein